MKPLVGIIMGSDSDLSVMRRAADVLEELGVPHELDIVSAHRTPDRLYEYASGAEARGLRVIVAGAGGAAHLPGMVAALTVLPVIGVPVAATALAGQDSLLSIAQMPAGVPVATVAIDNGYNAGLLAAQMLATADDQLRGRLRGLRADMRQKVLEKADTLRRTENRVLSTCELRRTANRRTSAPDSREPLTTGAGPTHPPLTSGGRTLGVLSR